MTSAYSYRDSVKSGYSDELINTYLLRPIAGILVRALYRTDVTPNHLTLAAIVCGLVSAMLYAGNVPALTLAAGLLLSIKDLLDSADGQLARAKQQYSRAGRFLDSIGDFVVNLAVFAAIGLALSDAKHGFPPLALAFLGFAGITLRVSYHVFYQTSYLHLQDAYGINRTNEMITEADRSAGAATRRLQAVYLALYGWQDTMMANLDTVCKKGLAGLPAADAAWYGDRVGLRLSGFLGMGTELFLVTACSVANRLDVYLWINVLGMNGLWLVNLLYRRVFLSRRVARLLRGETTSSSRPSSSL